MSICLFQTLLEFVEICLLLSLVILLIKVNYSPIILLQFRAKQQMTIDENYSVSACHVPSRSFVNGEF